MLRAILIGLGAGLVSRSSWVLYLFGACLIFIGIKMGIIADHMPDIANNPLLKHLKRHMRVTKGQRVNAFRVREPDAKTGKLGRFAKPRFLALVLVFIGRTIFLVGIIGKIPAVISRNVTFGLIPAGVLVSLWMTRGRPAIAESTWSRLSCSGRATRLLPSRSGRRCGR